MNIKDLRGKTAAELADQLLELQREQFNLRMQKGSGQLTQTHQVRKVRRNIARVKAVMGENEQG